EAFNSELSGVPLLMQLMKDLDPATQQALFSQLNSPEGKVLLGLTQGSENTGEPRLPKEQALALLQQQDWSRFRPQLLEFMLHQSKVLDIIPPKYQEFWIPIVHDALLYFLDHLPNDRLLERLVDIAYLPQGSTRGDYLDAFVAKTPSLQKLGQILAHNPALSPQYQAALQRFENGIHTMPRDELVEFIETDVGKANLDNYKVQFADTVLAEGSVGAVIQATCVRPGSEERVEVICKLVKPYALANLPQELEVIDGLAHYFTTEHDFYQLGTLPLPELFRDIRKALTDEINIVKEQQNFKMARQYYHKNKNIIVPEIFPISTNHATFMEFIQGEKISTAFEGQPKERAILARRFFDVMTTDVIFSPNKIPIFHGDPHAGNVFRVTNNPKDPYQIALLDWGLYGTFPREDRLALMQLILGMQLKDKKRLHNNVGALLENGLPSSPEKLQRIDAIIEEVLKPQIARSSFDRLEELLGDCINEGYATKF